MTLSLGQLSWNPGLDNADQSLGTLYQTLPGNLAGTIPWYVRLLEHPNSPLALAGAVDLLGHDCIHVLIGRGLLQQDEAFVLGFTMGRSGCCPSWQAALFRWCARYLYCGEYRFDPIDSQVFAFALDAARRLPGAPLHSIDVRAWLERPLGELRATLAIEPEQLRSVYAVEAERWPHTAASARLRVAFGQGALTTPEVAGHGVDRRRQEGATTDVECGTAQPSGSLKQDQEYSKLFQRPRAPAPRHAGSI